MYERPQLQRFGTFRELTKFGPDAGTDIGSAFGISAPGCSTENNGNEFGCAATRGSR